MIYTEYFNSDRIHLRQSHTNDDEFHLTHNYCPFGTSIDYTLKAGTVASIRDQGNQSTVHFHTKVNYFNVLHHEINEMLADTLKRPEIDENRKRRVIHGLKYLAATVRRTKHPREISDDMVPPTEMVFDILLKFKAVPYPPIELLAQCFEVCAALVPLFGSEIYNRVINLEILPFISNEQLDYQAYSNGASFDSGAVGYYLVTFEKSLGRYDFLMAYLKFLRTFTKVSFNTKLRFEWIE